jgi:hypothetical protein
LPLVATVMSDPAKISRLAAVISLVVKKTLGLTRGWRS